MDLTLTPVDHDPYTDTSGGIPHITVTPAEENAPAAPVVPAQPQPTPLDLAGWLGQYLAPNITSLARGEPPPPIAPLPEQGKVPSTEDPRIAQAAFEASQFLPGPEQWAGWGAAGMKAAVPAIGRMVRLVEHAGADPWMGAAPLRMMEAHPEDYGRAMTASKAAHKFGESLDDMPTDFGDLRTFLSPDSQAGFAMTPDGNIKYVFKHPNSPVKGAANSMLATAVQNGGNRLDAFDGVLPDIYGRSGFRAVARLKWNDLHAPAGWNYARDGRPDVVFMVHDPYHGVGYSKLDGAYVDTADEGFNLAKVEADKVQKRLADTKNRFNDLTRQTTGLKNIGSFLTPAEQDMVTSRNADALVRAFTDLPFKPEEMAAVAYSARAKRGWYRQSAQALVNIFGVKDAPRFTALLAALSPQSSVEDNALNALKVWTAWKQAREPQTVADIGRILEENVQQGAAEKGTSVLPAWKPNALRALMSKDPAALNISGPKVNSFMLNLRNAVHEVTNDAWIANYANIDQELFGGGRPKSLTDPYGTFGVKSPGYMAMSSRVRQAADVLSNKTGEVWTPAEIQETVWSWAKTLFEKAYRGGLKDTTVEKLLKAGNITHDEIANTPDFATLFANNIYRKILEQGGYGEQIKAVEAAAAARSGRAGGAPRYVGTPLSAEGSGFTEPSFQRHLRAAGRRLDERRREQLSVQLE
jgi:hypothetical protein